MNTGAINVPDTPAADPASSRRCIAGAPKKMTGPATPSRLRQVMLQNVSSSPSLVTAADLPQSSPLQGKNGNRITNSINGLKRLRTNDSASLEYVARDLVGRSAPTDCHDQVALALDRDRRLYEAKMKLFQGCAEAIDKTLQKAGTELYPYAKEFSTFFASCLNK